MTILGHLHQNLVFDRRTRVLSGRIAGLLEDNSQVLDIGCGDGTISSLIAATSRNTEVKGIDILVRQATKIPVTEFNGFDIPYDDQSFDYAILIDVLHHSDDPLRLMAEASRVARKGVIIKDHLRRGIISEWLLRLMDWVGNARHGVVLPYHYFNSSEWQQSFEQLNLEAQVWDDDCQLYGAPLEWLFGGKLHFIAKMVHR